MTGLVALARSELQARAVIFLATGGVPALFASRAWQLSAEGREFAARSSEAWGEANRTAGADPAAAARGVANTTAFYAPDPDTVS